MVARDCKGGDITGVFVVQGHSLVSVRLFGVGGYLLLGKGGVVHNGDRTLEMKTTLSAGIRM
jgi:hypothetical protein